MKSNLLSIFSMLCAVVAIALLMAPVAHATVIAFEGFSYSDGDLVANNGGSGGWTSAWRNSVDTPALCTAPASGTSCFSVDVAGRSNSDIAIGGLIGGVERTLNGGVAAFTTVYFGFDLKRTSNTVGDIYGIRLGTTGDGSANEMIITSLAGGGTQTDYRLLVEVGGGGVLTPVDSVSGDVFHRIVAKLEWDVGGSNERLTVWVDPAANDETANATGDLQHTAGNLGNGSVLDGMALGITGRNVSSEPVYELDNLNVTTTFGEARTAAIPDKNPQLSQRELDSKSGNGLFARMWRTAACPETKEPQYPSIVALDGQDELLLMFTHKPDGKEGGVLAVSRTSNGGKTWSEPKSVYSSGSKVPRALGTLTRLSSGKLLAPISEKPGTFRMVSSEDNAKSWKVSDSFECEPLLSAMPYGRLVELNGQLLMSVFGQLSVDGKETPCSGLLRSKDGGQTWGDFSIIACDRQEAKIAFGPTAIHADRSGRLLALISANKFLYRSVSTDEGKTWTPPEQRLMASNAALSSVGPTLACVNQSDGVVRVQFSENLFDSWRCDRMLDFGIPGKNTSVVALDNDRLLLVYDRGTQERVSTHGTLVNEGIEVAMMQRNPAVPPFPKSIIPAEKRDRWEFSKEFTTSIPIGFGEVTQTPDGRLLAYSLDGIFESSDEGKTFQKICTAPKSTHNQANFGVLRSGRWLLTYPDWGLAHEQHEEMNWDGQCRKVPSQDGYSYFELSGVKGVDKFWAYYSDDQGKTWHGGEQPIAVPLVWSQPYGRIFELEDGTVLMTTYGCLSHEDTSSRFDCAGLYRSTDGGKTWGDFTRVAYDEEGHKIAYNEMDIQPMPDGTWTAVIRTEWRNHGEAEASSSSVCFSSDQGRTWTKPEFAFISAVPMLALLPDGGLACATSFNKVRFSYDGGHTWSREIPSHTRHYPGVQLLGKEKNLLFVHDRWLKNRACIYRRIPAADK